MLIAYLKVSQVVESEVVVGDDGWPPWVALPGHQDLSRGRLDHLLYRFVGLLAQQRPRQQRTTPAVQGGAGTQLRIVLRGLQS